MTGPIDRRGYEILRDLVIAIGRKLGSWWAWIRKIVKDLA